MIMLIITFPDYTLDFRFSLKGGVFFKGGVFLSGFTLMAVNIRCLPSSRLTLKFLDSHNEDAKIPGMFRKYHPPDTGTRRPQALPRYSFQTSPVLSVLNVMVSFGVSNQTLLGSANPNHLNTQFWKTPAPIFTARRENVREKVPNQQYWRWLKIHFRWVL